jgi:hypothetical protein
VALRSTITAALVLAAVALADSLPAAAAQQSSVAVQRCPTTYATKQTAPRLPARIDVAASGRATRQLVAYSDGVLILLGPRGWHCHALVDADGSAAIAVAAGSPLHLAQPALTESFAETPDDAASLACSLFPAAAQQLPSGVPCPIRRPRRESTATLGNDALSFADPAGVHGDGRPSGGSDRARGVLAFLAAGSGFSGYAFKATCTLPQASRATCATVLNDALTRIPVNE